MRIVAVITDPGECKHSLEVDKIFEKYTHGTWYHVYTFKSLTKKKRERGSNLPLTLLIGCSFKMLFFQIFLFLHPLFQERTYITYSKLLPYIIPCFGILYPQRSRHEYNEVHMNNMGQVKI